MLDNLLLYITLYYHGIHVIPYCTCIFHMLLYIKNLWFATRNRYGRL